MIRDLPDTEENMWKKDIVRKLRLKYVKSNNSGHNNYGHIYFKQVKELKLKFPTYIPWFAMFNQTFCRILVTVANGNSSRKSILYNLG